MMSMPVLLAAALIDGTMCGMIGRLKKDGLRRPAVESEVLPAARRRHRIGPPEHGGQQL
jgi:hypothetical protein